MNDIRQRVWAYLAQSDVPRTAESVSESVNCTLSSAVDALNWWYDQGELCFWTQVSKGQLNTDSYYTIKDRT